MAAGLIRSKKVSKAPEAEEPEASEPKKSEFLAFSEVVADFLKTAVWPLFGVFLILTFWTPFHDAIGELPDIVRRSEEITLGQFSFKVNQSFSAPPSKQARQVLTKIDNLDFKRILETGRFRIWIPEAAEAGRDEYAHLVSLGVYRPMSNEELQAQSDFRVRPAYGVVITPLGEQTYNFLNELVFKVAQHLYPSQPSPSPTAETP